MMRRFGRRNDQWERFKHLLPGREGYGTDRARPPRTADCPPHAVSVVSRVNAGGTVVVIRRWFITTAINTGQPPDRLVLVAGQSEGRKGMTLGRCWHHADDPALRLR